MRTEEIEWDDEENRHNDLHIVLRIEFGMMFIYVWTVHFI